jgi:hypothetical protein
MEFQDPDFWITLLAGISGLFILGFWLWKGGRKSR